MALRLEIISPQRQQLGARGSVMLGAKGGTIGRAQDNDWALPDPLRFLSGHHARIHFRAGQYLIEDTSSNGVYLNDSGKPLGRNSLHELSPGDILRIGDYRILVQIDERDTAAAPFPGPAAMAKMAVQSVKPLRNPAPPQRLAADEDLGHSLDIASLIPQGALPIPEASTAQLRSITESGATSSTNSLPPSDASAMQERIGRLRAAVKARQEGTAPALPTQNGVQAFCRGAGIDVERVPASADAQTLQVAGRLLREALQGLKEIVRAQAAFCDHHNIKHPKPEGLSPLDFSVDEYLVELLNGHSKRRLDAVIQVRDHFADAAQHAAAVDPALRDSLTVFLSHLDPSRMDGMSPEAAWPRFREIFANLLRSSGDGLPHLFLEGLAQAYLESRRKQRS